MKSDSRAGCSREAAVPPSGPVDVPLVLYALATGVLAVSTGALITQAKQWGMLTDAISLLATVTITVVAGTSADMVLSWFNPPDQGQDSSRRPWSRDSGADRHIS